jgi:S-disulfanyl-L-cysteine oxidoreductase SoxD
MAYTQRTARRWLILLGALLLVFVVAVVWVIVTRNQGTPGTVQMATSQEEAETSEGAPAGNGDAQAVSEEQGWFTEDQANRGGDAYAQECAQCHGEQLEGGTGPALTGDTFWDRWEGDTVHTLFEVISQTMPQNAPGSLEIETYTAITAYILQTNEFPAGQEELPAEEDRLDELVIDRSLTAEGGEAATDGDAVAEAETNGEAADGEAETDTEAESNGDAETNGEAADDEAADAEADTNGEAADGEAETNGEAADGEADTDTEAETNGEAADGQAADDAEATDESDGEDDAGEPTADGAEGWFADAQVQSGQTAYTENCARCHGADLQGNPPLVGGGFPERYHTVWELYQYVRQAMPLDHPGTLRDQTYLDAIAYILDENGYPMGEHRREPLRHVLVEMELDTQDAAQTSSEREATGDDQAEDGQADDGQAQDGQAQDDQTQNGQAEDGAGQEDGQTNDEGSTEEQASTDGSSSADGYYPQEQADRGQESYAQHCAECHGDDLQGEPPLTGETFLSSHETVWDLYEYTRQNMPQDDPGSLEDDTYADIVAYVLSENDFPADGDELGPDGQETMQNLELDPEAAGGEGSQQGADDGQAEDAEAENGQTEDAQSEDERTQDEGASDDQEDGAAEAEGEDREAAEDGERAGPELPELATLEIDARPANLTLNILGPDGLARRAVGAQTLEDLQPGRYVIAGSRGHESLTVNVEVAAGETARVSLVLDELSRSADVPEEPSVPLTEIPAIPKEPADDALIGERPPGPFTVAQETRQIGSIAELDADFAAGRGQRAFALHCARCHGIDLQGNVAPALGGDVFFERWGGHPVDWLYFQARAAMPPHGAGFLSEQTYTDIITYILTVNGTLEGFESFTPDDEAFRTLVIEPRRTDDGRPALEEQVDRLRETLHGPQDDETLGVTGPVVPVEWPDDPGVAPIGYRGRIDSAAVMEAGDLSEAGPDEGEEGDGADGDDGENGEAPAEEGDDAEPTGEPDETDVDGEPGAPDDENDEPNDEGGDIGVPDAVHRPAAITSRAA